MTASAAQDAFRRHHLQQVPEQRRHLQPQRKHASERSHELGTCSPRSSTSGAGAGPNAVRVLWVPVGIIRSETGVTWPPEGELDARAVAVAIGCAHVERVECSLGGCVIWFQVLNKRACEKTTLNRSQKKMHRKYQCTCVESFSVAFLQTLEMCKHMRSTTSLAKSPPSCRQAARVNVCFMM